MIASRRRDTAHESPPPPVHPDAREDPDDSTVADVEEIAEAAEAEDAGWRPGRAWRLLALSVLLLLGAGYLVAAWQLEVGTVDHPEIGVYPRAAGLLYVLFLAVVLVREVLTQTRAEQNADTPDGEASVGQGWLTRPWVKPVAVLGAVLFYVLTVQLLGHIVSGAVAMAIVLGVAGQRAWWKVLAIAALCSVLTYALISVVLGLPLPMGQLGLEF